MILTGKFEVLGTNSFATLVTGEKKRVIKLLENALQEIAKKGPKLKYDANPVMECYQLV